jgi:cellulose synthase/poly-beta-1,6-N-acetylglucosamine synthase-like glycosyltransferase
VSAADHDLPFVSVIVPVRNGERTLDPCLSSVVAQDYPPDRHEILVVDNASTDRTSEIIDAYPVRHLREQHRGVSNARNRGIEEARGEIVAFIDGDCVAVSDWLRKLVQPFADPEVGCVGGELQHADATTSAQRQATRMLGRWQQFAFTSNPSYAITANAAFRRSVFDQIGRFDPRMTRAQDVEIGLRFNQLSPLRLAFGEGAIARHQHRPSQLGFFRQQLGWAYGAGLVGAKHRAVLGHRGEPRLREIARAAQGVWLVLVARARGNARREHLEDAWYGLLRQIAWWSGGWAGIIRGSRLWPDST